MGLGRGGWGWMVEDDGWSLDVEMVDWLMS